MKSYLTVICFLTVMLSCQSNKSGQFEFSESYEEKRDEEELKPTYKSELQISFESSDAQLKYAKRMASEGKFKEATAALTDLESSRSTTGEIRQEALLGLGEVFENVLNPNRNYETALHYYQKLVADFPESDSRLKAEEGMRRCQEIINRR